MKRLRQKRPVVMASVLALVVIGAAFAGASSSSPPPTALSYQLTSGSGFTITYCTVVTP